MRIIRIIFRTIVGLTFMFSGFVKGIDPLGSVYKFNEYFEVYGMEWLSPLALFLAVLLCAIEFTIGVMLVFGVKPKLSAWLSFIMMFFFTGLTFLSAINNPVSDCGCFGDAVKLTNWETFYKNVVLIILVLFLLFTYKFAKSAFKVKNEISIIILGAGLIVFVSIYSLRHLPVIDFLPWKVGNKISEQMTPIPEISESILVYKDKITSDTFQYTAKTLPYKDSAKWASIKYDTTIKKITQEFKEAPIHDFIISDFEGDTLTDSIVANPGYQFILVAHDLTETNKIIYAEINKFVEGCDKDSISFVGLTGTIQETVEIFRHDVNAIFQFYNVDETALKSMVRANPGILLLKDGVVLAKWHWRDLPIYEEVKKDYLK
ncbi:MAG: BT_3928 family protein [Bacteroidota bacterium]